MKKISILFLFILIAFLFSCDKSPQQPDMSYESELYVFGLLMLNEQEKIIRVEETYKVDEYFPENRGIANASVVIHTDSLSVIFDHLANGEYTDRGGDLFLKAGERYSLSVSLPDGRQAWATTLMPHPPEITVPKSHASIKARSPLQVSWKASDQAFQYLVHVSNDARTFNISSRTDSTSVSMFPFLFANQGIYYIKVNASDRNYYEYVSSYDSREASVNIDGALGVFGAVAGDAISVFAN